MLSYFLLNIKKYLYIYKMQGSTTELITQLKALADPVRLRLLALCVRGEADVDGFVDQALGRLLDLAPGRLAPASGEVDPASPDLASPSSGSHRSGEPARPGRSRESEWRGAPASSGARSAEDRARGTAYESAADDDLPPIEEDDDDLPPLDDDLGGGENLAQIELIPMDSGALLTPEEIEAFRE